MEQLSDFFLDSYRDASTFNIILEAVVFIFGILSVYYSKKENLLVYPTGLIATVITVYLLYKAEYYGDMMMNFYLHMDQLIMIRLIGLVMIRKAHVLHQLTYSTMFYPIKKKGIGLIILVYQQIYVEQ